jgi:hypothetical protein
MKSKISLRYRSSYLSKIMRRLNLMNLLSSRLRRLMKRLLRKSNLRKLMMTHSSPQIQHQSNKRFPINNTNQLKSPLNNFPTKRKQEKSIPPLRET